MALDPEQWEAEERHRQEAVAKLRKNQQARDEAKFGERIPHPAEAPPKPEVEEGAEPEVGESVPVEAKIEGVTQRKIPESKLPQPKEAPPQPPVVVQSELMGGAEGAAPSLDTASQPQGEHQAAAHRDTPNDIRKSQSVAPMGERQARVQERAQQRQHHGTSEAPHHQGGMMMGGMGGESRVVNAVPGDPGGSGMGGGHGNEQAMILIQLTMQTALLQKIAEKVGAHW